MTVERKTQKSKWSDIADLRRPNATWRLGKAARWYAQVLGLPADAIMFVRPTGSSARSDKKLGSLRDEWMKHGMLR